MSARVVTSGPLRPAIDSRRDLDDDLIYDFVG